MGQKTEKNTANERLLRLAPSQQQQAGSILHIIRDRNTYDSFARRSYLHSHHLHHIANFLVYMWDSRRRTDLHRSETLKETYGRLGQGNKYKGSHKLRHSKVNSDPTRFETCRVFKNNENVL